MKYPETFWCVGCECDYPIETMKGGLCPQCHVTFNNRAHTQKELWTIRLCLFGLVLIGIAVIAGPPF